MELLLAPVNGGGYAISIVSAVLSFSLTVTWIPLYIE